MSRYSGRCDCYDSLVMIRQYTEEELKNNVEVYIGKGEEQIRLSIESKEDLIPYYAHLVSMGYYNKDSEKSVVHLTSESSVDLEEREFLEWYLESILRIYNRCKRKKIEFNVEDAIKEVYWELDGWNKEQITELANRVKLHGKKATIDGIHFNMCERYRQKLVDEMLRNNLNPCDYGDYERFIKKV